MVTSYAELASKLQEVGKTVVFFPLRKGKRKEVVMAEAAYNQMMAKGRENPLRWCYQTLRTGTKLLNEAMDRLIETNRRNERQEASRATQDILTDMGIMMAALGIWIETGVARKEAGK